MIRFRTIDPEKPEKTPAPAPQPVQAEPAEAAGSDDPVPGRPGLTRKTPLRAKKRETAPLFEKPAPAGED